MKTGRARGFVRADYCRGQAVGRFDRGPPRRRRISTPGGCRTRLLVPSSSRRPR